MRTDRCSFKSSANDTAMDNSLDKTPSTNNPEFCTDFSEGFPYSIVVVGISHYQDREMVLLVQKYGMLCQVCEICIL